MARVAGVEAQEPEVTLREFAGLGAGEIRPFFFADLYLLRIDAKITSSARPEV